MNDAQRQPTPAESAVVAEVRKLQEERDSALSVLADVVASVTATYINGDALASISAETLAEARRLLGL